MRPGEHGGYGWRSWLTAAALAPVAIAFGPNAPAIGAITVEVVKSFERIPAGVQSELVAGPDGALCGTSFNSIDGTIFRVETTGALTVVHSFDFEAEGYPTGERLVLRNGAFYGRTASSYHGGRTYKVDTAGTFRVLRDEACRILLLDTGGVLYAVCGSTLFKIDSQDTFVPLHTFDVAPPTSLVTGASGGELFGIVSEYSRSFVFRLDRSGVVTPIYAFNGPPEEGYVTGELVVGSDGALYGAISGAGFYDDTLPTRAGSVFRVDTAGNFSLVHKFSGLDGASPTRLTLGSDGSLYGLTRSGGSSGNGTLFRIDGAGSFATVHSFGSRVQSPERRILTVGAGAAIYGVVGRTVFRVDDTGTAEVLHVFPSVLGWTASYGSALGHAAGGRVYGIESGPRDDDTGCCSPYTRSVFSIGADAQVTTLRSFPRPDGSIPRAPLVLGKNGALYGRTSAEGASDGGTIFRLDTAGAFRSLASLPGSSFVPDLVVASDGVVYGSVAVTTGGVCGSGEGGPSPGLLFAVDPEGDYSIAHVFDCDAPVPLSLTAGNGGTVWGAALGRLGFRIFRFDPSADFTSVATTGRPSRLTLGPDGGIYGSSPASDTIPTSFRIDDTLVPTVLHFFDRDAPVGPLSLGEDGAFYGSTTATLFRMDPSGGFSSLHSFAAGEGGPPSEAMIVGSDGAMYGTTAAGGLFDRGTVFRIDASGAYTLLHSFGGGDGANPRAALVVGQDGALYGSTERGGSSDRGTLFRVLRSGAFESIHSFTGRDGARPFTALTLGLDGALYGTAPEGGPDGGGVVYRVVVPLSQTVVFEPLPDHHLGDPPFAPSAEASSGLPVAFAASGSCKLEDGQVVLIGVGVCTLVASQAGDDRFVPAQASQSFDVLFDFRGFLVPVLNPPASNRVIAGQTVPIRFGLGVDAGQHVAGDSTPGVRRVSCSTLVPMGELEPAAGAGSKRLLHSRGSERYAFLWKTRGSWAGSCRQFVLELVDGTTHSAYFSFKGGATATPSRSRR